MAATTTTTASQVDAPLLDPVPAAAALPVPAPAPAPAAEEDKASALSVYSGLQRAPDTNAEKEQDNEAGTADVLCAYTVSMKRDRDEDEEEAKEEPPAKRPRTDDQPMVSTQ